MKRSGRSPAQGVSARPSDAPARSDPADRSDAAAPAGSAAATPSGPADRLEAVARLDRLEAAVRARPTVRAASGRPDGSARPASHSAAKLARSRTKAARRAGAPGTHPGAPGTKPSRAAGAAAARSREAVPGRLVSTASPGGKRPLHGDHAAAARARPEEDVGGPATKEAPSAPPGRHRAEPRILPKVRRPFEEPPMYRRRSTARPPWWRPAVPWTMYRYFVVEIFRVFILCNLAVSLLYTTLVAYQTVRSGLRVSLIWPLIAKTFAYPLYYSVPVSFLFALTLVISRMAGDLEITALRTHGVSYRQLYAPVIGVAIVLAGFSFYINGWIVPHVRYEKRNLHKYILAQLEDLGAGENRRIRLPGNKGTLFVKAYRGTDLRQVHITLNTNKSANLAPALREHLPEGLPSEISVFAREGDLEIRPDLNTVFLNLRGVDVLVPESVGKARVAGDKFHQRVAISDTVVIPLRFGRKRPSTKDRTNPELLEYIDELKAAAIEEAAIAEAERARQAAAPARVVPASFREEEALAEDEPDDEPEEKRRASSWQKLQDARTEWYRRLTFSLSCLTFPLVGVALALFRNHGNRLVPFFLGNAVVIAIFYPLLMVGVSLGERGWAPMLSLALPNVALIGLGVYLTRRVIRE